MPSSKLLLAVLLVATLAATAFYDPLLLAAVAILNWAGMVILAEPRLRLPPDTNMTDKEKLGRILYEVQQLRNYEPKIVQLVTDIIGPLDPEEVDDGTA